MDFRFTNNFALSRLDEIVSYLLGPRLWVPHSDYPDFIDWAGRTYKELKKEQKRAMVALEGNNVVGVSIYQRHKKQSEFLEIKNLTVRPDKRGRYLASFLLRNSEIEGAREFSSKSIVCDAKASNFEIRNFLYRNHYKALGSEDIYGFGGGDDVIFNKPVLSHLS